MRQEIGVMLDMQNAMNAKVHSDWLNQGFAWYRAIWVECAELMDHYGWKWWKQQQPDMDQVVLEIVDIWHFGLSILLINNPERRALPEIIEKALAADVEEVDFRVALEDFTAETLRSKAFSVEKFAVLMKSVDLSFNELYRRYLGKNVLNFFRQDNGYKEGTYNKTWNGKEDNEHLVEAMNALDISLENARDALYEELQRRYTHA